MAAPTSDQVHVPNAGGKGKGKGKPAMGKEPFGGKKAPPFAPKTQAKKPAKRGK